MTRAPVGTARHHTEREAPVGRCGGQATASGELISGQHARVHFPSGSCYRARSHLSELLGVEHYEKIKTRWTKALLLGHIGPCPSTEDLPDPCPALLEGGIPTR